MIGVSSDPQELSELERKVRVWIDGHTGQLALVGQIPSLKMGKQKAHIAADFLIVAGKMYQNRLALADKNAPVMG